MITIYLQTLSFKIDCLPTYILVNDFKWLMRSWWIMVISFDSKYSSVVSAGTPRGISFSLLREQRTIVPVQTQDGGQYPSPKQPLSSSPKHLNSWWGRSLMRISCPFPETVHVGWEPERPRLRSQSENQAKWQLQLKGFDARWLKSLKTKIRFLTIRFFVYTNSSGLTENTHSVWRLVK